MRHLNHIQEKKKLMISIFIYQKSFDGSNTETKTCTLEEK